MTGLSLLPLLALLSCVSAPGVDAQPRLTPELLWKLRRVSDPQLSPDGLSLLYTLRTYDLVANAGTSQIFLRFQPDSPNVGGTVGIGEAEHWRYG